MRHTSILATESHHDDVFPAADRGAPVAASLCPSGPRVAAPYAFISSSISSASMGMLAIMSRAPSFVIT